MPIEKHCLSLDCPERKSVCCKAQSGLSLNGKMFVCSKCGKEFIGGKCTAGEYKKQEECKHEYEWHGVLPSRQNCKKCGLLRSTIEHPDKSVKEKKFNFEDPKQREEVIKSSGLKSNQDMRESVKEEIPEEYLQGDWRDRYLVKDDWVNELYNRFGNVTGSLQGVSLAIEFENFIRQTLSQQRAKIKEEVEKICMDTFSGKTFREHKELDIFYKRLEQL